MSEEETKHTTEEIEKKVEEESTHKSKKHHKKKKEVSTEESTTAGGADDAQEEKKKKKKDKKKKEKKDKKKKEEEEEEEVKEEKKEDEPEKDKEEEVKKEEPEKDKEEEVKEEKKIDESAKSKSKSQSSEEEEEKEEKKEKKKEEKEDKEDKEDNSESEASKKEVSGDKASSAKYDTLPEIKDLDADEEDEVNEYGKRDVEKKAQRRIEHSRIKHVPPPSKITFKGNSDDDAKDVFTLIISGDAEGAKAALADPKVVNSTVTVAEDMGLITPLHCICMAGKADLLETALKNGANPLARDAYDNTVLHMCAYYGHFHTAKMLLAALPEETTKLLINKRNIAGMTALYIAAVRGDDKMVKLFLVHNSDPNL